MATLNVANAQIALGATAANAASTAPTLGFYAKAGATHTQNQSSNTQTTQAFTGTRIDANTTTFVGETLTTKGLTGDIGKLNVDHLNTLILTHGTTTNTTQSQSSANTTDASISTTGNMSVGVGRQQSNQSSMATLAQDTKKAAKFQ